MPSRYTVTIPKLRHLTVVAETLNLTKAAERLNISQPALSRSIMAIEQSYGLSLFDRRPTGLALTEVGKRVVSEAQALLERIRSYDHTLRLIGRGEDGQVSFGIAPQLASILLPAIGATMFGQGAQLSARIFIRPTHELIDLLRRDQVELCIIAEKMSDKDGIVLKVLGESEAGFYVRPGHPLSIRKSISVEEMAEFTVGCGSDMRIPDFDGHNVKTFVCNNFDILKKVTVQSDFICLMSGKFAREAGLVRLNTTELPTFATGISAASLEGRSLSPASQRIIQKATELLCGNLGD